MRFSEIPDHSDLKNKLINSVKNNRVSHAQLFYGPEGCNKLALAIAYAQYIDCTNKIENPSAELIGDSCGLCPSCLKFNRLVHPDLHFFYPISTTKEIDKKPMSSDFLPRWRKILFEKKYIITLNDWYDEIGLENKQGILNVDDCNDIIHKLNYKSYESEYKIVIIWMAEKFYHSAAPKLLKILEEPAPKTLFILLAENIEAILTTILSRTQLIKIKPYSDEEISKILQENYNCNIQQAKKISHLCSGNLYNAINLIEAIDEESYNFKNLRNWLLMCYYNKFSEITEFIEEISKVGREKQKAFFQYGLFIIRYCLLENYSNSELINLPEDEKTFVAKLSKIIKPEKCQSITEEFNKAIYHVERNANPKLLFMNLSFKLAELIK